MTIAKKALPLATDLSIRRLELLLRIQVLQTQQIYRMLGAIRIQTIPGEPPDKHVADAAKVTAQQLDIIEKVVMKGLAMLGPVGGDEPFQGESELEDLLKEALKNQA